VKLGAALRSVAFEAAVLDAPALEAARSVPAAAATATAPADFAPLDFAKDLDMPRVEFASTTYSDEKVANREIKGWARRGRKGSLNDGKIQKPSRRDCRSCRYLTLCRGVLDLSIIQ
jgi:hypothetical protein